MGLLDHKELQIIKGVGPTPGDTASAEQPLVVLDLLQESSGLSVIDWSPNIPSLKNGGVWADSPISDGRLLTAGAETNVVETMVLQLSGNTAQVVAARFNQLRRMAQDARLFWDSQWQIEPVYLKWWANNAPGPQYALIFNIDMDNQFEDSNDSQDRITLSIEREYGWRGVVPGGNPKEWTKYAVGGAWDVSKYSLIGSSADDSSLASGSLSNMSEWTNDTTQSININYLDIPAAKIPGDLPSLALVAILTSAAVGSIYVGRNSKPTSQTTRDNNAVEHQYNDLAAAVLSSSNLGTDTTLATDTGAILYAAASANRRRAEISFATVATDTMRLRWQNLFGQARPLIGLNMFRGRFVAFLRARQTGGAAGDIKMHLEVGYNGGIGETFETSEISPTVQTGTGNTTAWPLTYMGVINIPPNTKASIDNNGLGLLSRGNNSSAVNLMIALNARRTTGAGVLYVSDLILMPMDESLSKMSVSADDSSTFLLDTTGYINRLDSDVAAGIGGVSEGYPLVTVELAGCGVTLVPGKNNRLYLFGHEVDNTSSITGLGFTTYVNIVPRWSGIRDA